MSNEARPQSTRSSSSGVVSVVNSWLFEHKISAPTTQSQGGDSRGIARTVLPSPPSLLPSTPSHEQLEGPALMSELLWQAVGQIEASNRDMVAAVKQEQACFTIDLMKAMSKDQERCFGGFDDVKREHSEHFEQQRQWLSSFLEEKHEALANSLEGKLEKFQHELSKGPSAKKVGSLLHSSSSPSIFTPSSKAISAKTNSASDLHKEDDSENKSVLGRSKNQEKVAKRLSVIADRKNNALRKYIKRNKDKTPTRFAAFVEGDSFVAACSVLIVINTIIIGCAADVSLKNALNKPPLEDTGWIAHINRVFTIIFTVELLVRIAALKCMFFIGSSYAWNWFDAALVVTSLVDELADVFNVSYFRSLKIIRMGRAIRIIRVFRFIRELRLMVCSVFASMASLFWAFCLLVIIMYLFAIVFVQGVTLHVQDERTPDHEVEILSEWYKSVMWSMYTLLLAISGGKDWHDLAWPLQIMHPVYVAFFSLYTTFVLFGLLNVLTGVFVDRATEISQLDRDLVIQSEMDRTDAFYKEMRKIFKEADTEKDGKITWFQFQEYLEREDVQAYFAALQLDTTETRELFRLIDKNSVGAVNIEEFIFGCLRVKGLAKSLDVLRIEEELRLTNRRIKELNMLLHCHFGTFSEASEIELPDLECEGALSAYSSRLDVDI